MADTELHQDIRAMRAEIQQLVANVATASANISSLDRRLYNGGSGAIPTLWKQMEEAKAVAAAAQKAAESAKNSLRLSKAYIAGFACCASMLGGGFVLAIKFALAKAGIHF